MLPHTKDKGNQFCGEIIVGCHQKSVVLGRRPMKGSNTAKQKGKSQLIVLATTNLSDTEMSENLPFSDTLLWLDSISCSPDPRALMNQKNLIPIRSWSGLWLGQPRQGTGPGLGRTFVELVLEAYRRRNHWLLSCFRATWQGKLRP